MEYTKTTVVVFFLELKPICIIFAAMKKIYVFYSKHSCCWFSVVLAVVMMLCACSSSRSDEMIEETEESDPFDIGYKGRVDFKGDTLRVLILGNSFSSDATIYLNEMSEASRLDHNRFCVYNGVISGGGITDWMKTLENDAERSYYRMAGAIAMNVSGALRDILNQPWDVCMILQKSDASFKWDSFGNLSRLVDGIKSHCPNKQLQLAYMMPWTHTVEATRKEWAGNISCARKIAKEYGIRVIPVGTAIQNARKQGLDNELYLTRDGWHLCYGVGRFIAACAMYEGLLSSFAGKSILDNPGVHTFTPEEARVQGAMAVDSSNAMICKQCAFWAVEKPFATTAGQ